MRLAFPRSASREGRTGKNSVYQAYSTKYRPKRLFFTIVTKTKQENSVLTIRKEAESDSPRIFSEGKKEGRRYFRRPAGAFNLNSPFVKHI